MRALKRASLALALTGVLCGLSAGENQQQDAWHGRVTPTSVAYEAVRFTLNDAVIRASSHARLQADNDLVDFGGGIHQAVPGGWEVHVYLNFEPVGAATPAGDIETLVFVNDGGFAEYFLAVDDPTLIDDPTIPPSGLQINNCWQYDATAAAVNDIEVQLLAHDRLDSGVLWFDTDAELVHQWPTYRKIDVTLVFLNPDGSPPPAGLGDIVARVRVEEDLSDATVVHIWDR